MSVMRSVWVVVPTLLFVDVLASCASDDVTGPETPPAEAGLPSTDGDGAPDSAAPEIDAGRRTCSLDGWCHTVVPTGLDGGVVAPLSLQDVWSTGNEAWAVTLSGSILRFDGSEWTIEYASTEPLYGIWGTSPEDAWAVGANGQILHRSVKGGTATWTAVASGTTDKLSAVWGSGSADVWIASATGLLRSTGAPGTPEFGFATVDIPEAVRGELSGFYRIAGTNDANVWLSGPEPCEDPGTTGCWFEESRVLHYRKLPDGGAAWSRIPVRAGPFLDPQVVGVAVSPEQSLFVLGNDVSGGQGCFVTDPIVGADPGLSWFDNGVCSYNRGIWMKSSTQGWAVGRGGLAQEWDGTNWKPAKLTVTEVPVAVTLNAVKGSSSDVWIVGEGIALRRRLP